MAEPRGIRRDTSLGMYECSLLWPCPLHGKNHAPKTQVITPMKKSLADNNAKNHAEGLPENNPEDLAKINARRLLAK